jgi:PadR family transcriptional regulator PadR
MEADGLIESYQGEPLSDRGGRPRRYYHITAKGRSVADSDATNFYSLFKLALAARI